MIDAGDMTKRATVYRTPLTPNGAGESVAGTPEALGATVWAALRPAGSIEATKYANIERQTSHIIRMRWRDDVQASDYVQIGSRRFEIQGLINVEEKNEELKLFVCETT